MPTVRKCPMPNPSNAEWSGLFANDLSDFASASTSLAIQIKEKICVEQRGPADGQPMLLWGKSDGSAFARCVDSPNDEQDAPEIVREALLSAFVEFGKPRFVSFWAEAVAYHPKDIEEAKSIERGELETRFREGVNDVFEVIAVITFDFTGHRKVNVVPFVYDDRGIPVFKSYGDEKSSPMGSDTSDGGAFVHVINDFVKFVNAE